MTELNPKMDPETHAASETDPDTAGEPVEAGIGWPLLPAGATPRDPAVDALLERLGGLPEQPVSVHGEVYSGLHDDLMEALNEDVTGHNAAGES